MKKISILLVLVVLIGTSSFKVMDMPPGRTLQLIYVDNSYSKKYENFSLDLLDVLDKKIDSLKNDKFSSIVFFLSDGDKNNFAGNYNGAKINIEKISNGNTSAPNTSADKSALISGLFTVDLSNIKNININLFITEATLVSDCIGGLNAGILINTFPKELQYLLKCSEENIKVVLYYPATSKKVTQNILESFTNFSNVHNYFESKISFSFQPI